MPTLSQVATLIHGFTMDDVDHATRRAVRLTYWYPLSQPERWDIAWSAVVEFLYASDEPPSIEECSRAAAHEVSREVQRTQRQRGVSQQGDETPQFRKYWLGVSDPMPDFTDPIVERMALPEVLALLTDHQYQALSAVAVHDTQQQAADALGISTQTLGHHLRNARARIMEAWYQHETPRGPLNKKALTDTCSQRHPRGEFGYKGADGSWRCRKCRNESNRRSRRRGSMLLVEKSLAADEHAEDEQ